MQPTKRTFTVLYTDFAEEGPVPGHTEQQLRPAKAKANTTASKATFTIGSKVMAEYEAGEWYAGVVEVSLRALGDAAAAAAAAIATTTTVATCWVEGRSRA